ncbi:dioxygenase [Mycobacterium sp. SMC-4]|uniref:dioxygenase family protein n=1 Tax=Mycobacterium sp. SMC-4 TaxID=2857059 RepID=UPI003D0445EB
MHTQDDLTAHAIARWATARDPRLADIMAAVVRHLHELAREIMLTEVEWEAAMRWLVRAGQASDGKRNEFILASDVLGLSMLVVELNSRLGARATPATVLGPFHISGSPRLEYGADMSEGVPGTPLFVTGTVRDLHGNPVPGAVIDVWQADADGAYEAQLEVSQARLRATYISNADGAYCLRTVAPRGYSIPMDGPVGELITRTAISPFRPAHIHFWIDAPGYEPLITHLFEKGGQYLDSDVVFGTKPELVVEFERRDPGTTPRGDRCDVPWLLVTHDFVLQPKAEEDQKDWT